MPQNSISKYFWTCICNWRWTTTPYTVSISQAPTTDLTVSFTYSGVAVNGTDFTGVASVVIKAGTTSSTFTIATLDDNLAEGAEKFKVAINPSVWKSWWIRGCKSKYCK